MFRLISLGVVLCLLATAANAQDALPESILSRVKAAVVLVRVDAAGQPGTLGSGVLVHKARESGLIATNHHVVAAAVGQGCSVVFRSGQADEMTADAYVVASDPDKDIAFLKVSVDKLPAPMRVDAAAVLRETLTVYAAGFPFGERLEKRRGNPSMTVTRATISSLRHDDEGGVYRIQVSGDVNPGNSGGPLVTASGDLIGLLVSAVRGTQIGFAIPAADVQRGLDGYVRDAQLNAIATGAGKATVKIQALLVDPLARVDSLQVLLAPATRDLPTVKGSDGGWEPLRDAQQCALTRAGDVAHGELELTHGKPGSARYAWQIVTRGGVTRYSRPRELAVEFRAEAPRESESPKGGPGWLERPATPTTVPSGSPTRPSRALVRSREAVVDATVEVLDVPARHIVAQPQWSRDGSALLIVDVQGELRKVSVPEWVELTVKSLNEEVSAAALCSDGMLLAMADLQELWVIDVESLAIVRRIPTGPIAQLAACPSLPWAFITRGGDSTALTILDTRTGKVVRVLSAGMLAQWGRARIDRHPDAKTLVTGFGQLNVSPDGKFLLAVSGDAIHRFRIQGDDLEYEAVSASVVQGELYLSPDGQYVGVQARRVEAAGHPTDRDCGYFVYRVDDFRRPVVTLPHPNDGALAFDPVGGRLYVGTRGAVLTYDPTGAPLKRYGLGTGSGPFPLRTLLVHPAGRRLLAQSREVAAWFTFPEGPSRANGAGRPVATRRSVQGEARTVGGVRVVPLAVGGGPNSRRQPTIEAMLSPHGESVYVLEQEGLLRRIATADLVEQVQLKLPGGCGSLQWSGAGILVLCRSTQELLVLDGTTLETTRTIAVAEASEVVAGRDARDAYCLRDQELFRVDLDAGQVAVVPVRMENGPHCQIHPDVRTAQRAVPLVRRLSGFVRISADGRAAILLSDRALTRVSIQADRWVREQVGPPIAQAGFSWSEDGYVASPVYRAARATDGPLSGIQVYRTDDLATPIVSVEALCPAALNGISHRILCAAYNRRVVAEVLADGSLERLIRLFGENSSEYVQELHLHPDGRRVLVVSNNQVHLLEWPGEAKSTVALSGPRPEAATQSLTDVQFTTDRATAVRLNVSVDKLLPEAAWFMDEDCVFLLHRTGRLLKLRLSDLTVVRTLEIGASCTSLSQCAQALLVACDEQQEVWVIDPATLESRRRITVPQPARIRGARGAGVAIVSGADLVRGMDVPSRLTVLDVNAGLVTDRLPANQIRGQSSLRDWDITPDGKWFLLVGELGLSRFRIESGRLQFDSAGPWLEKGRAPRFALSADGSLVGLQVIHVENPELADYKSFAYGWLVFRLTELNKPLATVADRSNALAFDATCRGVYVGADHLVSWVSLTPDGPNRWTVGPNRGQTAEFILPHPAGRGVLVGSREGLYWVTPRP